MKRDEGLKAIRHARILSPNMSCPLIVWPESIEKDAQPTVLVVPREEEEVSILAPKATLDIKQTFSADLLK